MKKRTVSLLELEKEVLISERKNGGDEIKTYKNMNDYFKITIIKKSLIIV